MKNLHRSLLLATLVVAVPSVHADIQLGGSRASVVGGGGIALPLNPGNNVRLNPAVLAFNQKSGIRWPNLGFSTRGIDLGDVDRLLGTVGKGAVDPDELLQFGLDFGRENSSVDLNAGLGFSFRNFAFDVSSEASIQTVPNALLRDFAGGGQPDPGAQLDGYGLGNYEFTASYGYPVRVPQGSLALGATARLVRTYYSHYKAQYNGGGDTVIPGDEMGGRDYLSKSGFGLDLGGIYTNDSLKNIHLGFTVQNLIEPNVSFDREAPDGGPVRSNVIKPYRRQFNVGAGTVLANGKLTAYVDVRDVFGKNGGSSLSAGGQFSILSNLSVGAGYNTRDAWTIGVNVFGLNISFGGADPFGLGYGIRF